MNFTRLGLIFLLVLVWGFNFVVIKVGLQGVPPIFLACARFILTTFPAIFFFKRPAAPFSRVVLYGLVIFAAQFTFFFMGMKLGVPPGLASILLQVHVFFSLALASVMFHEKIKLWQIVGAVISFSGIAYAGMHIHGDVSMLGFFCLILAAALWGTGSAISKTLGKVNMISLVVWGSMVAWPPLLLVSLIVEGPHAIASSLENMSWMSFGSIAYLTYLATFFGYGLWSWLLHHMPLSTVAPFTLLVPVVALLSSAVVFGEPIETWKIVTSALVIGGLCINFLVPRFLKKKPKGIDKNSSLIT